MSKPATFSSTIAAAGCSLALGLTDPSFGATTIDFIFKQQNQGDVPQAAYISDGRMLIRAAGGDPNIDLLFEQASQTMTIINHEEKSVLDLNAEKVSALAGQASGMLDMARQQLLAQMDSLPEAQREQLKQMVESMGGGQLMEPPPPPPAQQTLREAGVREVNGFACSRTEVYEGDRKVAEVCSAPADVLGIPEEDFAVIESLRAMSQMLRKETAKISNQMGQGVPQFGHADVPGVPVAMRDEDGNTMTITSIRQGIGEVQVATPMDYEVREMPTLPQIVQ